MSIIEQRRYNKPSTTIFESLLSIISKSGFKINKVEKEIKRIDVSTGASLFSFGEKLEIIVSTEGSQSLVYVKSEAVVPWNISADAKGKLKYIFDELDKVVK